MTDQQWNKILINAYYPLIPNNQFSFHDPQVEKAIIVSGSNFLQKIAK